MPQRGKVLVELEIVEFDVQPVDGAVVARHRIPGKVLLVPGLVEHGDCILIVEPLSAV